MSEQKAKELADRLRAISPGGFVSQMVNDAAAELDRLAELCDERAKEWADVDSRRAQYREWYYKASDDRAKLQHELDQAKAELRHRADLLAAGETERDTLRAQVQTLTAERDAVRQSLDFANSQITGQAKRIAECGRMNSDLYENHKRLNTELATMREDRDALAEGVRAYRDLEGIRAWECKHGHRADAGKEPARKVDEVAAPTTYLFISQSNDPVIEEVAKAVRDAINEKNQEPEKPPLLDLRTLPVGTVCEAVNEIRCAFGPPIKSGERFTIKTQEPADYDGAMPVQVTYGDQTPWLFDKQSARVITQPEPKPQPAPEPFRAGLPALALRRAHKEWDNDNGSRLLFDNEAETWRYVLLFGDPNHDAIVWKIKDGPLSDRLRPHGATWHEVELKAARLLGKKQGECPKGCFADHAGWLRSELGITEPRDMTALWAAFREGQKS